jgi:hypothetical protein
MLPNPIKQQEAIARNTFKTFDTSGDGSLDTSELGTLLKKLGADFTDEELVQALAEIDEDHSGSIAVEEFILWWTNRAADRRTNSSVISWKMRKLAKKAATVFFADPFVAAWNGDLQLMTALIEADKRFAKSVDDSDFGGKWTVLQYACYKGHIDVVRIILEAVESVHVNQPNQLGFTALFYAAQRGHADICRLLLDRNADPSIAGESVSPLKLVSASPTNDDQTLSTQDRVFMCPVEHILSFPKLRSVFEGHQKCVAPRIPSSKNIDAVLSVYNSTLTIELTGAQKLLSELPIKHWLCNLQVRVKDELIECNDLLMLAELSRGVVIKIPGQLDTRADGGRVDRVKTCFQAQLGSNEWSSSLHFVSLLHKIKRFELVEASVFGLQDVWLAILQTYNQVDPSLRSKIDLYGILIDVLDRCGDVTGSAALRTNLNDSMAYNREAQKREADAKAKQQASKKIQSEKDNASGGCKVVVGNQLVIEINAAVKDMISKATVVTAVPTNKNKGSKQQPVHVVTRRWRLVAPDRELISAQLKVAAVNSWASSGLSSPIAVDVVMYKPSGKDPTVVTQLNDGALVMASSLSSEELQAVDDDRRAVFDRTRSYDPVDVIEKPLDVDDDDDDHDQEEELNVVAGSLSGRCKVALTLEESPSQSSPLFTVGDEVEGNYKGQGVWYPGVIGAAHGDGRYDLHYDDGERETRVDGSLIRLSVAEEPSFVVGFKVEGNYQGMGNWYPGVIGRINGDGTYGVRYDDGDSEQYVPLQHLRPML